MKNLIFLCLSTVVVIFSIIVLNVGPNIKGYSNNNYDESCSHYKDKYELYKEKSIADINLILSPNLSDDDDKKEWLDLLKEGKNTCYRHKAMIGLEYATFNINVLFGFICALLGLLKYSGNNLGKIVGILGLVTGIIGFVLTLVYVIYSGIIFNNEVYNKSFENPKTSYNSAYIRTKSDGAFREFDDSKKRYVCIFYDKNNKDSVYARYSDFGKKVFNYNKDIKYSTLTKEYKYRIFPYGCLASNSLSSPSLWNACKDDDEDPETTNGEKRKYYDDNGEELGKCDKLYVADTNASDYEKKNYYDYWVISIVFSCLIIVSHIGLAIFGFLSFKE